MNRTSLVIFLAASMVATVGCASKNYVKAADDATDQQDQRTRRPDREELPRTSRTLTRARRPASQP